MKPLEFLVWVLLASFTLLVLVTWLPKKRRYKNGRLDDTAEIVSFYTVPRVVIAWALILLAFLVVELSTLYLLLIFPCVYIFLYLRMAKKVLKEDESGLKTE